MRDRVVWSKEIRAGWKRASADSGELKQRVLRLVPRAPNIRRERAALAQDDREWERWAARGKQRVLRLMPRAPNIRRKRAAFAQDDREWKRGAAR